MNRLKGFLHWLNGHRWSEWKVLRRWGNCVALYSECYGCHKIKKKSVWFD